MVGAGLMTGPFLNMGCEARVDADCRLVGMVFCLGFFEGRTSTRDYRHLLLSTELYFYFGCLQLSVTSQVIVQYILKIFGRS